MSTNTNDKHKQETMPKTDDDAPQSSGGGSSDKALRRRYKKLRKRATTLVAGPLSGILTPADWQEFVKGRQAYEMTATTAEANKDQTSAAIGGPQIRWRNIRYEQQQSVQIMEGATQRDVLYYLLQKDRRSTQQQTDPPPSSNEDQTSPDKQAIEVNDNGKRKPQQQASGKVPLPTWVTLHNAIGVSSVVLLEVHVPSSSMLQSLRSSLAATAAAQQEHHCLVVPTRWFNNNTPKSIAECLLYATPPKPPKRSKKQALAERIQNTTELYQTLRTMCLSSDLLEKEGYPTTSDDEKDHATMLPPLPSEQATTQIPLEQAQAIIQPFTVKLKPKNGADEDELYVASPVPKDAAAPPEIGQIYALDCEMVQTVAGKALARFTLIQVKEYNANKKSVTCDTVWDTLVQPDVKVTNYLTEYSGVSAEMLEKGPAVRLAQVQAFLLRQLQPHDILVGHSLENDLQACRFIHGTCVDTAVLFRPANRNFKYSLRNLTYQLLKRSIQQSDRAHCSEEDARASLDLAVRRAAEGPSFSIADTRSLNQWVTLAKDRTTVAVGPVAWLRKHITSQPSAVHALSCQGVQDDSRKAVLAWIGGSKRRADLVWACFEVTKDSDESALVEYVSEITKKASPLGDTVVGIALQSRHTPCATMSQHRRARQSGKATLDWTEEEEKRFTELAFECQQGSMIWLSSKH